MLKSMRHWAAVVYILGPIVLLAWKVTLAPVDARGGIPGASGLLVKWGILLLNGGAFVFWILIARGIGKRTSRPQLLYFTFWIWMTVCSGVAGLLHGNLRGLVIAIVMAFSWMSIFWTVRLFLRDRTDFRFLFQFMRLLGVAISGSIYLGLVLYRTTGFQFGEVVNVEQLGFFRCFGPLGDQVGFVVVLFIIGALAKRRWLEAGYHIGAIVLTGTRGAMLSALVGIVWLLLRRERSQSRSQHAYQVVAIVVFLVVTIVTFSSYDMGRTTSGRIGDVNELSYAADSRFAAFHLAGKVIWANPFVGTGWGGFRDNWRPYGDSVYLPFPEDLVERGMYYTQNQMLQMGTDGGIPAMLLFGMFVMALFGAFKVTISRAAPEDRVDLRVFDAYVAAIVFGNQTAVWFDNGMSIGFFVMICSGAILRYHILISRDAIGAVRGKAS